MPHRTILRYHGGKWLLAPWIIAHLPPHDVYVEPYGGGASVLLQKPPISAEVYNDLDGRVVNVFKVLQDKVKAAELGRRCALTPFAREIFEWSYDEPVDDIDAAHRTIVLSFFGHGSDTITRSCRTGFRAKLTGMNALPARYWATWYEAVPSFTERLKGVLIEQCDAIALMHRMDGAHVLHYCDPPYLPETRSAIADGRARSHGYRYEMTREQHVALLEEVKTLSGYVVLSGYPNALYDDVLQGWRRVEKRTFADGARERTEILWINPRASDALAGRGSVVAQTHLFA